MLDNPLRHWPSFKPTLVQHIVFTGVRKERSRGVIKLKAAYHLAIIGLFM